MGALRGVILHDAIFRALKARGFEVKYLFGVDDYDPLDEIPKGQGEHFEKYRGAPLCNVPAPAGSSAPDMAEHFISEFFDIFGEIGVEAERYRMRDKYRSGAMNESIDRILAKADVVRQVYKDVSGSVKGPSWHPFQTVCENCGRVGTTEVVAYDGKEVEYFCRPNMVKWAKGCGHHGKTSPFDGKGKLPWKLEWVAKWRMFGVTIEGAGKDHTTKGGARDVSGACLTALFGEAPPYNVPYEFFLSKGKKMQLLEGRRHVGARHGRLSRAGGPALPHPAHPAADAGRLPPRVRRPRPAGPDVPGGGVHRQALQRFRPAEEARHSLDPKARDDEKELYRLCETHREDDFFEASFQLVLTYVQMPHVDIAAEMEKRKGSPLTELERKHLDERVRSARFWLENFARDEERTTLQEALPARAEELGQVQRAFLRRLADAVKGAEWKEDVLQAKVFDTARRTPIAQGAAFQAIYRVFLDKPQGPPAGALMAVLPRDFVEKRLGELPYDDDAFWRETAVTLEQVQAAVEKEKLKIERVATMSVGEERAEVEVTHTDGKVYVHRLMGSAAKEMVARAGQP